MTLTDAAQRVGVSSDTLLRWVRRAVARDRDGNYHGCGVNIASRERAER